MIYEKISGIIKMSYVQQHRPKHLPSLNNEELWHFLGDRGVYSESPDHMLSCFDVFVHSEGCLYYRMKLVQERSIVNNVVTGLSLFSGVTFHDPMEVFINRKETGEEVAIMSTHRLNEENDLEEVDELENEKTIPFSTFQSLNLI